MGYLLSKKFRLVGINSIRINSRAVATDATTHKKIFGSGATTLMFSNEEINNIMKIIRPLVESSLLIRSLGQTIKNEAKEQK